MHDLAIGFEVSVFDVRGLEVGVGLGPAAAADGDAGESSLVGGSAQSEESGDQPASGEPTETAEESGSDLKAPGAVLTGIGLATVVAGGITGGMALAKNKQLDKDCNGETICDNDFENDEKTRDALGITSTVLIASGAAIATAGIVMLIVNKKRTSEQVSVTPVVAPQLAGATLQVRF